MEKAMRRAEAARAGWGSRAGLPLRGAHRGRPGAAATPCHAPVYLEISEKCRAQRFLVGLHYNHIIEAI